MTDPAATNPAALNTGMTADHPAPTGPMHRSVLLIGASRGLGLALTAEFLRRGADVTATIRSSGGDALEHAAEGAPGRLRIEHVDTTADDQIRALAGRLTGQRFDLLLVNAGTTHDQSLTAASIAADEFARVMITNALAPLRLLDALDGVVAPDGTVAVMSSGQGSVAGNTRGGGWELYRASKAALNQLMRSYAARQPHPDRTLLLLAPGWVRTDMGGAGASSSIEEAIPPLVDTIEAQRHHGELQFLDRDGRPVPW